jgi:hypothetical protein
MREEMKSIEAAGTWNLVPLPPGRQAIDCKWVFAIKHNLDGSERTKARLVAKGFTQRQGIDYHETFAPVARLPSLRALLSIACKDDLEIHQMDVRTAFLNGPLQEVIYMRQPEGFVAPDQEQLVCQLKKALYGLKQAGRAWFQLIDSVLVKLDFRPLHADNCVYVLREQATVIYLLLYVDDLLIVSNDLHRLKLIKSELSSRFDMKDLGEAQSILGLQIHRDRSQRHLSLSQSQSIKAVLERFGMQECSPAATPMSAGQKLLQSDCPTDLVEQDEMRRVPYSQAVGAVMYIMLGTRPDISHAVTALSQFMKNPGRPHWIAMKRLLRYLKGTQHIHLVYQASSYDPHRPAELYGYTDSDWGNDINDRRSITGWTFIQHGGAVSWQSRKQRTVALSSVEAEYMSASSAVREAIWWRTFLSELGMPPSVPTVIYSDSQGSIALAKNPEHHNRTKHIDIQHHFVREQLARRTVALEFMGTADMVADVLTKPLSRDRHEMLISRMGVRADTVALRSSGSVGGCEEQRVSVAARCAYRSSRTD